MYFYTLVRIYDGNMIHLMKFYSSDIDSLKRHGHFYDSDVVTISRFNQQDGEFIPMLVRLPHSSEWVPARTVNIRKQIAAANAD